MTGRRTLGLAVLMLLAVGGTAHADGGMRIDQAWTRATAGNARTGALYVTITNTGTVTDRLIAVNTPVADKAEPHESKMNNGVMEMRPLGPVSIAPGKTFTFAPNADHIMLTGLKAPLKLGDQVPVTLTFEHAGAVQTTASVAKAGAMSGDDMPSMPGMSH